MRYTLDLKVISIQEYKDLITRQNLLPGRRLLWQNIDERFKAISEQNITNIEELKKRLSTPQKMSSFVTATGISGEYLILLKREIGSLEQKPVSLECFPDIDQNLISKLISKGIKNSKEYFESSLHDTDELYCLCDLVRINGVGAVAAKAFYTAGYRSVQEVAGADAAVMLESVSKVNEAKHYYKAKLGIKDIQFCIDFASLLARYSVDCG
jgi:replicative superfamily II helicase